MHLFRTFFGYQTSYLRWCPSEKNLYAHKLQDNRTKLDTSRKLNKSSFPKKIILATCSFMKSQEPVQSEPAEGCLIEFNGYQIPR